MTTLAKPVLHIKKSSVSTPVKGEATAKQEPRRSKFKKKFRKQWVPPTEVKGTLKTIVNLLLDLEKGEQKWIVKRLAELWTPESGNRTAENKQNGSAPKEHNPPTSRTAKPVTRKEKDKTDAKTREAGFKKIKKSWKVRWEAHETYKHWKSLVKQNPTPEESAEYQKARNACFLVRSELRTKA